MKMGSIEVKINVDAKKILDVIEKIAEILQPYDLTDKDIDKVSELLKSCLKTEGNK